MGPTINLFFGVHIIRVTKLGLKSRTWLISCFCRLAVYFSLIWRDLQFTRESQLAIFTEFFYDNYYFLHLAAAVRSMVFLSKQQFGKCILGKGAPSKSIMCQSTSTTLMDYRQELQYCTYVKFPMMERKIICNIYRSSKKKEQVIT